MVPVIMKARYGLPEPKAPEANRTIIGPVVHSMQNRVLYTPSFEPTGSEGEFPVTGLKESGKIC